MDYCNSFSSSATAVGPLNLNDTMPLSTCALWADTAHCIQSDHEVGTTAYAGLGDGRRPPSSVNERKSSHESSSQEELHKERIQQFVRLAPSPSTCPHWVRLTWQPTTWLTTPFPPSTGQTIWNLLPSKGQRLTKRIRVCHHKMLTSL